MEVAQVLLVVVAVVLGDTEQMFLVLHLVATLLQKRALLVLWELLTR